MTRLFLHRLFWAIYDYLGTITAVSFLGGVIIWLTFYALLGTSSSSSIPAPVIVSVFLGLVAFICFLWWFCVAALLGKKVAAEEPVRLNTLFANMRGFLRGALAYVLTVTFGVILILANIRFYSLLAAELGGGYRMLAASLSLLLIYFFVCFAAYSLALLGTWAVGREGRFIKGIFREALMHLSLLPRLWFTALLLWLVFAVLCVISVVGTVFIVPCWCLFGCMAFKTSAEFVEMLGVAKSELGEAQALKQYRRRAAELCMEREMRKPSRTWKDIFKPWEY